MPAVASREREPRKRWGCPVTGDRPTTAPLPLRGVTFVYININMNRSHDKEGKIIASLISKRSEIIPASDV